MKKGGSAALAAMLRQRSEVIQTGGTPAPPPALVALQPPQPLNEGEMPKRTHPAAQALEEAVNRPKPPAPRNISPNPARPAGDASEGGPLLMSHPKRNFSPTPARNASPTPQPTGRTTSPTPALRSAASAPAAAPRSISPIAGLPKTIPFHGANKCHLCDKTVYKMEEIIAVGHVWHDKCFTCGGKTLTEAGCGRVLRRDGYLDHDGEPFCQACYSKHYRPKGFNAGVGINTDYGGAQGEVVERSPARGALDTQASKPSPPAPPMNKPAPPAPPAQPSPKPVATLPTAAPTASTGTSQLGGGNKCSLCQKTVYKMEEIIALGRVFHDKCFTCGGVNKDGCGKVLKRDGYVDHENEPYCAPCYQRMFGPKTFGYGLSAESTVPNGSQHAAASKPADAPAPAPTVTKPAPPVAKPAPPAPAPVPAAPGMVKSQPVTGKVTIGTTSKAEQSGLFKEAAYVGDNDEVDDSEW